MSEKLNWLEKYRPVTFDDFWQQNVDGLDLLRAAVEHHRVPPLTICVAPYGVGKTSLARVLARRFNCWHPVHPYNPCGTCKACKNIRPWEGGTFVRCGYLEFDATEVTPKEMISSIRSHVPYYKIESSGTDCAHKSWIVCIDEIAQAKNGLQKHLIKLVENMKHGRFFLCYSDPTKISDPIRERGVKVELPLPTSDEATSALIRIAEAEGYALDTLAAKQIAESVKRVPRRCILALEQASLLCNSKTIDLDAVSRATGLVAK